MKKVKNNLPKSWGVLNDGSQQFKDTVFKYLQENYMDWKQWHSDLNGKYFGINLEGNDRYGDISKFGKILTIDKFIELSKPIMEKEPTIKDLEKQISKLNKKLEELKNSPEYKYEIGKWYTHNGCLINYQGKNKDFPNQGVGFGFGNPNSGKDYWEQNLIFTYDYGWELADMGIVYDRLEREAKKRGLVVSNIIDKGNGDKQLGSSYYMCDITNTLSGGHFDDYKPEHNCFWNNGMNRNQLLLDDKGNWATVVKKTINIGEYNVKWDGSTLHVGCQRIPLFLVERCYQNMVELNATEITIRNIKITLEKIKEVLDLRK